ncbi:hypothetical protein BCR35DRAFT_354208 [Leucosporidium creatinivorum]|uniref:Uncharacterized protein n=1 Tax=Leucosporidium creatinivorum TaxID=106004 RepID=A0A1Y2ENI5_9BASI|nr:hypothetical protein BCR35DRAFT_354208 [Leucosporidium creatinivorum]
MRWHLSTTMTGAGVATTSTRSACDARQPRLRRGKMTTNECAATSSNTSTASPTTSHSDSMGPSLSDFAPLEDAHSDWTPSDASGDHEEEESFDMVASGDWSEGSRESETRSRTSSSGDDSRMRLSFPDPISSVGNLSSKQLNGDLGASITDETAYSFLLDAAPAPSLDSPRSVTSSLPSTDDAPSSIAESNPPPLLDDHPSTPPESSEPERPQLKDRAISDWLKLTGEARAEKDKEENSKQAAVSGTVENAPLAAVESPLGTTSNLLKVVFVGGDENERQIVLDQLERLEGVQTDVVEDVQGDSAGLVVRFVNHAGKLQEDVNRVDDKSIPRTLTIVVPTPSLDNSPTTSTQSSLASLASLASTDSSRTVQGRGDLRLSSFLLPAIKKPSDSLVALGSQEKGATSKIFRLEDLVAADEQALSDAIKESLLPLDGKAATNEEQKDDPATSFKKSMVSRTLLLLTAALAIAAASLLETSPSFGALRSVNQVAPPQQAIASSSASAHTTSTTQPIASTSTLSSPVQSLPAAETPALLDPPPAATACSIGRPGACALAVVEAQNSLALLATKLAGSPSLFGAPNTSAKVAAESGKAEEESVIERKRARTRRIIEHKAHRKALRPRRSTVKPKRKSLHFCSSSSSSTPPTSATVPSLREALYIITNSAHHQAQQLTHRLSTTHLPRAHRHLHRASSSVRILSHRAEVHLRLGARKALHHHTAIRQQAQRQLDAAAPQMEAFARQGEQKLKEVVRGGEERIRSFAKLSDQHLHAATIRAGRHLNAVARLAQEKQIPRRLRDSSTRFAEGAMRFGKEHLVRAAGAVEAIQNGEIGVLGGVKGCGSLEGGVRERCEKRKRRERERRRKEKVAKKEGEATERRAETGGWW